MSLVTPREERRKPSRLRREQTVLGCPMDRHRATWCQGLCQPHRGRGVCGRIAPHAMVGKTQRAIARQQARSA